MYSFNCCNGHTSTKEKLPGQRQIQNSCLSLQSTGRAKSLSTCVGLGALSFPVLLLVDPPVAAAEATYISFSQTEPVSGTWKRIIPFLPPIYVYITRKLNQALGNQRDEELVTRGFRGKANVDSLPIRFFNKHPRLPFISRLRRIQGFNWENLQIPCFSSSSPQH